MRWIFFACTCLLSTIMQGQLLSAGTSYSREDSLRGSIGAERAWWNATYYDVSVRPDLLEQSIAGQTEIHFTAIEEGQRMQIDLQQPLKVDSILLINGSKGTMDQPGAKVAYVREGDVVWVDLPTPLAAGRASILRIHYHGQPRIARMPPWDGGWVWAADRKGRPWVSVACQGLGASVWYPCKDHQSDEPDDGASLRITIPDSLVGVGNGRLKDTVANDDGTTTWHWAVTSPINTYNIIPYIGKYVHFGEHHQGLQGRLDVDHWVLEDDLQKAREHFKQVIPMLACFEEMLGPFPWYADGFKLVQAPYLGMEHQSAIAYGNDFKMGYRGMDLSRSGHGNSFDYIIVHESGHEWYGNSITTADIADMWVHEGFTVYTEVAYVECIAGKEAGNEYLVGMRRNIVNDRPVIGPYGVNEEGSNDMYYKGAAVVHMVRAMMADDDAFWSMLRDMNREYRHAIVTSAMIEDLLDQRVEYDLRPFFDQYLRTTRVPRLEWRMEKRRLSYRWAGTLSTFSMPVDVLIDGVPIRLEPATEWKTLERRVRKRTDLLVDPRYYITSAKVGR